MKCEMDHTGAHVNVDCTESLRRKERVFTQAHVLRLEMGWADKDFLVPRMHLSPASSLSGSPTHLRTHLLHLTF